MLPHSSTGSMASLYGVDTLCFDEQPKDTQVKLLSRYFTLSEQCVREVASKADLQTLLPSQVGSPEVKDSLTTLMEGLAVDTGQPVEIAMLAALGPVTAYRVMCVVVSLASEHVWTSRWGVLVCVLGSCSILIRTCYLFRRSQSHVRSAAST